MGTEMRDAGLKYTSSSKHDSEKEKGDVDLNPWRRWFLFVFCFTTVSLCAGLVYGWPALRRNLREEGGSDLSERTLGGIYTAGAWSTQGGRFLFGLARDRYGTKVTAVFALTSVTGGSLGIALSDPNGAAQLGISLFLVGLGSGAQLCMQPVASLFSRSGTVLATLSGAFQISGLIFLILTRVPGNRKVTFVGFSVVMAGLTIMASLVLPKGSSFLPRKSNQSAYMGQEEASKSSRDIDTVEEAQAPGETTLFDDKVDSVGSEVESAEESDKSEAGKTAGDDKANPPSAYSQIKSLEYVLLVFWFSCCIVPLQYYIGSIGFQLEDKGDDDGFYTGLFSILYASAAGFAPAGGYICDSAGLGVAQGLATGLCAFSMFLLASDVGLDGQIAGLASYSIGRMLIFAMFFGNVGKRFGYENYGTLAGLGLLLSALISLLQYPLIAVAADGSATEVNAACGAVLASVLPYCAWLGLRERREQHVLVKDKSNSAEQDEFLEDSEQDV